jgi:dTMP kinase
MLITFEGIDGCGKSTQARLLAERLQGEGIETILIREPGGTRLSEHIRDIVLNTKYDHPLSHTSELLLFAASRAQLVKEVILPALAREAVVICDRFTDSTMAYQGYGRGIPLAHVAHVNSLASAELEPDLTFLIDVPIENAIERRKGMNDDRMEAESMVFFKNVLNGYMKLAEVHRDRIHVIDGLDSMEDVQHAIWRLVEYERGNDLRHASHAELSEASQSLLEAEPATYSFDVTSEVLAS